MCNLTLHCLPKSFHPIEAGTIASFFSTGAAHSTMVTTFSILLSFSQYFILFHPAIIILVLSKAAIEWRTWNKTLRDTLGIGLDLLAGEDPEHKDDDDVLCPRMYQISNWLLWSTVTTVLVCWLLTVPRRGPSHKLCTTRNKEAKVKVWLGRLCWKTLKTYCHCMQN